MKKKIVIAIAIILIVCLISSLIYQAGSYKPVLEGKIKYKSRLYCTSLLPTKIGHFTANGQDYNLKFIHPNCSASCLSTCYMAAINEKEITGCHFSGVELVQEKYFIVYHEFYKSNAGFIYNLDLDFLGRVDYEGNLTGEEIIVLYNQGEYIETYNHS